MMSSLNFCSPKIEMKYFWLIFKVNVGSRVHSTNNMIKPLPNYPTGWSLEVSKTCYSRSGNKIHFNWKWILIWVPKATNLFKETDTLWQKVFLQHLSALFNSLRVLLVKLKAFLWAPKKDFTPLCSKGVKFFFATATFFFATANFFLPTVVSTSSKKKVAVPQAVLIVPTLQWSRCFASKKYVVSSYMKLTLIHGIWNRNEDFIIFC